MKKKIYRAPLAKHFLPLVSYVKNVYPALYLVQNWLQHANRLYFLIIYIITDQVHI